MENIEGILVQDPPFDSRLFTWRTARVNGICIIRCARNQDFVAPYSCLCHAIVGAMEARYRLNRARISLSTDKQALSVHHYVNKCNSDLSKLTDINYAVDYFVRQGVPLELFYPSLDLPCMRFKPEKLLVHRTPLSVPEELELLADIKHDGPIVVLIPIYENYRSTYDIYDIADSSGPPKGTHAISLVGGALTNDDQRVAYFEFQNSMGVSWGWGGFGRVKPSSIITKITPIMGNFAEGCSLFKTSTTGKRTRDGDLLGEGRPRLS